jgi:hypothetical protein
LPDASLRIMALALLKYRIGNYFYAPRFQPRLGHVTMNRPALPAFECSMVKGAIKISLIQDQPLPRKWLRQDCRKERRS